MQRSREFIYQIIRPDEDPRVSTTFQQDPSTIANTKLFANLGRKRHLALMANVN